MILNSEIGFITDISIFKFNDLILRKQAIILFYDFTFRNRSYN